MPVDVRLTQSVTNSSLHRFMASTAEHFEIVRAADQGRSVSPPDNVMGSEPILGTAVFAAVAGSFEGDLPGRTIS